MRRKLYVIEQPIWKIIIVKNQGEAIKINLYWSVKSP